MEDFQRTLEEAGRQISRELQEAHQIKADPETTIRDREQTVSEALENAKAHYKRKEYARAFVEWDRACAALANGEEFRRKVRLLKESHENLVKVNQELAEIREVLGRRAAPQPADVKFVDGAHEAVNGQVKNVYAYLSEQLRAERTPRTVSFWWPVALAAVLLALGFTGLNVYHARAARQAALERESARSAEPSAVDDAFLQAQQNAMEKQVGALNRDREQQIEDLKRKHAEAAKGDRERIVQLETNLREAESKNSDLERQIQALLEDNLKKDNVIAALD